MPGWQAGCARGAQAPVARTCLVRTAATGQLCPGPRLPPRFLFGWEGFVSTVTSSSDSGIGEGTLRFRRPFPPPPGAQ